MDRLKEAFTKFLDSYRPLDYYGFYQCTLVKWDKASQTGDLKPDDPRLPKNGMSGIPFRSGIPGVTVDFGRSPSAKCMIGFEGGDPSKPYIHGWLNCTPSEVIVSGTKVVAKADSVYLVDGNATHPISFGDVTQKLIGAVVNLLQTMAPIGNLGIPVVFATDAAGSCEYGVGAATALGNMSFDVADMNSTKAKTG